MFDQVRIVSSRFEDEGIVAESIGYVIEIHSEDAFEVEGSDASSGETMGTAVVLACAVAHRMFARH